MNRHGTTFLIVFLATAAGVGYFVLAAEPVAALGIGVFGLLAHWVLSRSRTHDGEVADSSYFFGFLLTLVFLTVGLYRLGSAPADSTGVVFGFLTDLAAGLLLTISGLLVRQVRTLGNSTVGEANADEALLDVQRALSQDIRSLIEMWRERPEQRMVEEMQETRSRAREAAESLEQSVAVAGERMLASVGRLEEATSRATQSMTRTASALGESMSQTMQRIDAEIAHVLDALERQRNETAAALATAQTSASQIRQDAEAQVAEHAAQWQATLDHARTALTEAHRALDAEYRRGLEAFAASGTAFAELTTKTVQHVESLPNPAERLTGLWDGVEQLESTLTNAIEGSARELDALRERSVQLGDALARMGAVTEVAAKRFDGGGEQLAAALHRELRQMNNVIEQYVALLESSRSMQVRA